MEKMDKIDDMALLHLCYQCSHRLHANGKCHGQGRLLIQLLHKETLTQRELTDLTGRRSATLSEQLENMERAGYITRTRNEQDRRNVDVSLTPLGREAAVAAQRQRAERAHALFAALNPDDKEQLFKLLHKLLSEWENLPAESEAVSK